MIYFQNQPEPTININWHSQVLTGTYIEWHHGENKHSQENLRNLFKAGGPIDLVPRAQFVVGDDEAFYYWEDTVEW